MTLLGVARSGDTLERAIGARDFSFCNAATHRGESQFRTGGRNDFENLPHLMMFLLVKLAKCLVWTVECP